MFIMETKDCNFGIGYLEHVIENKCTACGSGTSNAAGDPVSGDDTACDVDVVIAGCQDSTACNYNSDATSGGVDCLL